MFHMWSQHRLLRITKISKSVWLPWKPHYLLKEIIYLTNFLTSYVWLDPRRVCPFKLRGIMSYHYRSQEVNYYFYKCSFIAFFLGSTISLQRIILSTLLHSTRIIRKLAPAIKDCIFSLLQILHIGCLYNFKLNSST